MGSTGPLLRAAVSARHSWRDCLPVSEAVFGRSALLTVTGANNIRPISVEYPNGRTVYYNYSDDAIGDKLNRVADIADGEGGSRKKFEKGDDGVRASLVISDWR